MSNAGALSSKGRSDEEEGLSVVEEDVRHGPGHLRPLRPSSRVSLSPAEREEIIQGIVAEITSIWQTAEIRKEKPTPVDGEQRIDLPSTASPLNDSFHDSRQ